MISLEQIQNPITIIVSISVILLLIVLAFLLKLITENKESELLIKDLKDHNDSYSRTVKNTTEKMETLSKQLLETREQRLEDLKRVAYLEKEVLRKEGIIQQMQKAANEATKITPRKRPPTKEV